MSKNRPKIDIFTASVDAIDRSRQRVDVDLAGRQKRRTCRRDRPLAATCRSLGIFSTDYAQPSIQSTGSRNMSMPERFPNGIRTPVDGVDRFIQPVDRKAFCRRVAETCRNHRLVHRTCRLSGSFSTGYVDLSIRSTDRPDVSIHAQRVDRYRESVDTVDTGRQRVDEGAPGRHVAGTGRSGRHERLAISEVISGKYL